MPFLRFKILHTAILFVMATSLWAHEHDGSVPIKYQENKGQWENDLLFRANTGAMDIFITDGKFMLGLKSREDFERIHDAHHGAIEMPDSIPVRFHNIEFDLLNAHSSRVSGQKVTSDYVNYFLGNDPEKWAGGVKQFEEVVMADVYENVDFALSSLGDYVKYEFRLAAGAHVADIAFQINGTDSLYLKDNQLHISNSIDELIDNEPIAWQLVNGEKQFVTCRYKLSGDTLSFEVPDHNKAYPLIIDPTLIFASYTGSGSDNWGSTATYDENGNLYAGGIVVSTIANMNSYPTVGAYQSSYAGATQANGLGTDIVISKFNSSGNNLVYSTYLGGSVNNEIPHSLVVNDNNELYLLATTSSSNFPTTTGAFDQTFNGGTSIPAGAGTGNSNSISYNAGSDIAIVKFSSAGSALLGSTFIGGTGNDGINQNTILQHYYSDEFRGEIIVDSNDNCYIATSTGSNDFPVVNGFQTVYGGGTTDGVVFKFNSNLTSLLWSSYIGGNLDDAAYSVQFGPNLDVYATGGTTGGDFPTTNGVLHPNYMGGTADGWVAKISNNGQNLLASTFIGTSAYDQSFFVQLDLQGNVYTVGQTEGNYPIGPSWVYSNPNSGQFLHKLTNNLQNTVFSTRWGSGNGAINLSLSAFLVNQCNHIFIAGWGGTTMGVGSLSPNTTTNGLPTTNNAVQTTTDGSDIYFIVFEDSATDVLFGSYYGGTGGSGAEHVDGGTSRFDKKGIIYQAVCASCGAGSAFPTTTGAYATQDGTPNRCNMGVIKYDLVTLIADADIDGPTQVCVNDSIAFANSSFGGSLYLWDFGDGITSDEFEPMHAYENPGNYTVTLIIYDSVSCIFADTDLIEVTVIPGPIASAPSVGKVCPDVPIQLSASGGQSYVWSPSAALDDPTSQTPIATVPISTIFVVSVTDSCGTDTAHVPVNVYPDKTDAQKDTALCRGLFGKLRAEGGLSYKWTPGTYLSSTTSPTPVCFPDSSIIYEVNIIDSFQCPREYKVKVAVEGFVPQIKANGDTSICAGDRIILTASGTDNYSWTPTEPVLDPALPTTPAFPEETTTFIVKTSNSCGAAFDTVLIKVLPIEVDAFSDTAVCAGDSVTLGATGSLIYQWTGAEFERPNYNQYPSILPKESGWYRVTGSNIAKCEKVDSLYVTVHPQPFLDLKTNEDTITGLTNVLLIADSESPHRWYSDGYVPCADCDSIRVYPLYETEYFVEVVDSNQCRVLDSITVEAISTIYIPKSFTPNGDAINDKLIVRGHNILDYEISIRNRWGEEIFKSRDMNRHWDGTKHNNGHPLGDGVYSYEIRYRVLPEEDLHQTGTITLLK